MLVACDFGRGGVLLFINKTSAPAPKYAPPVIEMISIEKMRIYDHQPYCGSVPSSIECLRAYIIPISDHELAQTGRELERRP